MTERTVRWLTEKELEARVMDLLGNKIYTSHGMDEQTVGLVFPAISLGAFKGWEREELDKIGVLYEYLDKAAPVMANGHPVFLSVRWMHREDWKTVLTRFRAADKAAKEAAKG